MTSYILRTSVFRGDNINQQDTHFVGDLGGAKERAEEIIRTRQGVRHVRIYACVAAISKVEKLEWTKID